MDGRASGAVFVLPNAGHGRTGPVAAWPTTGGWALGAQRLLGHAWVLADDGVFEPREAISRAVLGGTAPRMPRSRWRTLVPEPVVTLAKDARRAVAGRGHRVAATRGPWEDIETAFVWQRHELFRRCGLALARRLAAPLVLSVHALQVREAESWGVRRPGWSRLTERTAELPQLRAADLVACVSDHVAAQVAGLGVPDARVLVTPNGVDLDHFRPRPESAGLRERMGLNGRFVVGWSGSFRRFHGLDQALEAMVLLQSTHPEIVLLLIGDGLQRARLEAQARERGLTSVRFAGTVSYEDMPTYLGACDAGMVLAPASGTFHYSPVKLREYMACGLPVVAHAAGELRTTLRQGVDGLLIERGDPARLAEAFQQLARDRSLRDRMSEASRQASTKWSWERPVQAVLHALGR